MLVVTENSFSKTTGSHDDTSSRRGSHHPDCGRFQPPGMLSAFRSGR
jgi:hypothetical protein